MAMNRCFAFTNILFAASSCLAQSPPANDNFAQREVIVGSSNLIAIGADNGFATSEVGEPYPASCDQSHKTLWWTFTCPSVGILQVNAGGESNSVVWSIFRGDSLSQLQLAGSSCGLPTVLSVQSNETFQIKVDGAFGKSGWLTLWVKFSGRPPHDAFADSAHLEGTNVTFTANITASTSEPGEPPSVQPYAGATNTVWASWAAPFTGRAHIDYSIARPHGQSVTPYTGSSIASLQPVRLVAGGNLALDFLAVEGTIYHFQMAGSGDDCTFAVSILPFPSNTNDDFADAELLSGEAPACAPRSIAEASAEVGEPAHLGTMPYKSLWWRWRATANGNFRVYADPSLVPNVVIGIYSGNTVDALTLLRKGTNRTSYASLPVTAGNYYCIATAVPTDAVGDIAFYTALAKTAASQPVAGNLLQEPSWEGTAIYGSQYWRMSGSIGGSVNEGGGADGTTWPHLGFDTNNTQIWQDFQTVTGRNHSVQFALRAGSGDAQVQVLWDNQQIGIAKISAAEIGSWQWAEFTAMANNPTSRVTFVRLTSSTTVELDAFRVLSLAEPPQILSQPATTSTIQGGTAAFSVGAIGTAPLIYQWHFNGVPLSNATSRVLVLSNVSTNVAGQYRVSVTNAFGAVTSAPASLLVEAADKPVILWQPYGDMVSLGGSYRLNIVALGSPPLGYQWYKDGLPIAGATTHSLMLSNVQVAAAGVYSVRVDNPAGAVWSLPASISITDAFEGGGLVNFYNRFAGVPLADAPVFDVDGTTKLNGSNYLAQLYAGPSLELLRSVGQPSPFRSGFLEGFFYGQLVTLPNVPPSSNAIVQVRAWDGLEGSTYEEARALGGRFGKSGLLTVVAGGGMYLPADLLGMQSFSLSASRPQFATGMVQFKERQPGGIVIWSHFGEPGFRYLIERSFQDFEWKPYVVVTNITSSTTFTDSATSGSSVVFYRSRILD